LKLVKMNESLAEINEHAPPDSPEAQEISLKIENLVNNLALKKEQFEINQTKLSIFESLPARIDETNECTICYEQFDKVTMVVTPCSHIFCIGCLKQMIKHGSKCGMCRQKINEKDCHMVKNDHPEDHSEINKWGTKTARLIEYLRCILSNPGHRVIVFSQFQNMLKLISKVLIEVDTSHLMLNGNTSVVSSKIRKFKLDPSIRVVLLCSENSSSGLNLTEASHIILMDTLDCDKPEVAKMIEEQAIGRSVRLGQKRSVCVKRFVMLDTLEQEFYDNYVKMFGDD